MVTGLSRARSALEDVATLGAAFTLATGEDELGDAHLVPLARLLAEPGILRAHVARAAARLRSDEHRVAASWLFGDLAARLVAPVVATVATYRALPELVGADLRWRGPDAPGGTGWWVAEPRLVPVRDVDDVHEALVGPLSGLGSTLRTTVTVSERLLWGEVAAAVAKSSRAVALARPVAAPGIATLAAALLGRPPLRGTRVPGAGGRLTCCLAYRVPGGQTCADCPLGPRRAGAGILVHSRPGRRRPAPGPR